MKEIWKDIKGYDSYQVSNMGRVKSLERYDRLGRLVEEKILKPIKNTWGYYGVCLCKNGIGKILQIHKLVAIHFIPNTENLTEVNHKDENKENNCVDNLEWCTHKYNMNYGTRNLKASQSLLNNSKISKPVLQYTLDGILVKEYPSTQDAKRITKINQSNISQCCRNKRKTAGGYIWKYKNEGN